MLVGQEYRARAGGRLRERNASSIVRLSRDKFPKQFPRYLLIAAWLIPIMLITPPCLWLFSHSFIISKRHHWELEHNIS